MKRFRLLLALTCFCFGNDRSGIGEVADPRVQQEPPREDALLYRKLAIPESLLITQSGHTFGGDRRIGDFNGDGQCDFLVYRCNHGAPMGAHMGGIKPTFRGDFDLHGIPLWQVGDGGNHPSRPMSVDVKDWTGGGGGRLLAPDCHNRSTGTNLNGKWRHVLIPNTARRTERGILKPVGASTDSNGDTWLPAGNDVDRSLRSAVGDHHWKPIHAILSV